MSNKTKNIIGIFLLLTNLIIIKIFLGGTGSISFDDVLLIFILFIVTSLIYMIVPFIIKLVNKKRLDYQKGKKVSLINSLIIFVLSSIPIVIGLIKVKINEMSSFDPISFLKSLLVVITYFSITYYFINICFFVTTPVWKKTKTRIITNIFLFIIGLSTIIFSLKHINQQYVIHYVTSNHEYTIKPKKNNIEVSEIEIPKCLKESCEPKKRTIKLEKEHQELIEELFENEKEITINENNLPEKQKEIITSIIKEEIPKEDELTYNIVSSNQHNANYSQRGYYIEKQNDGSVMITIAMGKKNSGGCSISINRIKTNNGEALISVKESYPSKNELTTTVITYPITQVVFNKMPQKITVKSITDSKEFFHVDNNSLS